MNWSLDVDPRPKDVSNFATGRLRIATLLDATLTFQLVWDTASQPVSQTPQSSSTATLSGFYAGAYVTIYCFTSVASPTKYFIVQGMISKVTPAIASIEDAMLYNVEVSLSATSGSVTFIGQPQFSYPAT